MDKRSESRRFATFLTVGGLTALLNFGVFMFLWRVLGVQMDWAVGIAFAVALLVHFYMNRIQTFRGAAGALGPQVAKYLLVAALNYGITVAVVRLTTRVLGLAPPVGLLVAIGTTALCGYVLLRRCVFRAA